MIINLLKEILGLGGEALKSRRDIKLAEKKLELAHIEAKAKAIGKMVDAETGWEQLALQDVAASWKDEYWTLILSVPLILIFIPAMQPHIHNGFQSLASVPEWYKGGIALAWSLAFAKRSGVSMSGFFKRKN